MPELIITRLGIFDVAQGTACSVVLRFEMGEALVRGELHEGEMELMVVGRNDNGDPLLNLLLHGLGVSPMRAEVRNHWRSCGRGDGASQPGAPRATPWM